MTVKDPLPDNSKPKTIVEECRCALEDLLKKIHSPAALDELWPEMEKNPVYQDLIQNWGSWAESYQQRQWEALCREMEKAAYGTRPFCLRCGDCCRQGSPTLYFEDLPLLRRGIIQRLDIMTLRAGEIGFSNAAQDLVLIEEERIKIKEKAGGRECLFLETETAGCAIYSDRPLQCRVMECWNPDSYADLDSQKFISRKELLNPEDPLLPVIQSHEQRCGFVQLQKALSRLKRSYSDAQEEVLEMVFYDQHLREHLHRQQGIAPEFQLFLIGRPLIDLLPAYGFQLEEKNGLTQIRFGALNLQETIES